jgi:hypothetical protein
MRGAWLSLVALLPLAVLAQDLSEVSPYNAPEPDNYPYIVSGVEGRFYVRATPADNRGTTGITKVYRVGESRRDKLLATYRWYARPRNVILCGNPDTNAVAVVLHYKRSGRDIQNVPNEIVLKFFGSSESSVAYRVKDLEQFGAQVKRLAPEHSFYTQDYVVDGCERITKTQYVFTLRTESNKRIRFDIPTGRRIEPQ